MRSARSLFLAVSTAAVLIVFGGGQDPVHSHIVLGGTPAERAQALARHLAGELGAQDPDAAFGALGRLGAGPGAVRVVSVGSPGGGAAVLNAGSTVPVVAPTKSSGTLSTSHAPVRARPQPTAAAMYPRATDPPPRVG